MELYDVVHEFSEKINDIAFNMLIESTTPGMPSYIKTISNELFDIAKHYKKLANRIEKGEDL